jgi:hypothetical protein
MRQAPRSRLAFALAALSILPGTMPLQAAFSQASHESSADFQIPAQDLASALDRFSLATGVQLFYASDLARGRKSSPVVGRFSPEEALLRLLQGTGLRARLGASNGISIEPLGPQAAAAATASALAVSSRASAEVRLDTLRVEAPFGFPLRQRYGFYASSVRLQIREALLHNEALRSRRFSVQVNIWLDGAGLIAKSAMHRSSGIPGIDLAVARSLDGVIVRPEPPTGLPQPIHVEIISSGV